MDTQNTQNTDPTIVGTQPEPIVMVDTPEAYLEFQNAECLEL